MFDTSNYELDRSLLKKIAELGGKIMKEFAALRAKVYSYLIDHGS